MWVMGVLGSHASRPMEVPESAKTGSRSSLLHRPRFVARRRGSVAVRRSLHRPPAGRDTSTCVLLRVFVARGYAMLCYLSSGFCLEVRGVPLWRP